MSDENANSAVTVKGTFLGQPIDLTITECEVPAEGEGVTDLTDAAPSTPGEELPDGQVPPEDAPPAAPPSDPPPADTPVTEEPKNPAGNEEQL